MHRHILVIEDEEALCTTLGDRLQSEGYQVDFAKDGVSGFHKICNSRYDLAIVDVMLPLRSGLDLCADVRHAGLSIPIIMLTAKSQTTDKIVGLKMGADDYVCKPFDTSELMARIEAQLRHSSQRRGNDDSGGPRMFKLGAAVVLDTVRTQVTRDGQPLALTAKEYQLLHYLAEHRGKTISREELLLKVWELKAGTLTRTVDMHIAALRQKVERFPKKPELILTISGFGYRLASDTEIVAPESA